MRVLYFMNHVDQGGAALALIDLIAELRKTHQDYYPIVVTGKNNRLNQVLDKMGIENYTASFKNFLSSYREPILLVRLLLVLRYEIGKFIAYKEIKKIIDFKSIDIVHSNLNRIDIGAILSKRYTIPHVWHIREHGEIDFRLVSVKKNPIEYMNSFDSTFVAVSNSVDRLWKRRGINPDSIRIVYDGIRPELYDRVKERRINSDGRMYFVFLGGYAIEKGQEECIRAIGALPMEYLNQIKIDFYGNGSKKYLRYLNDLISKLNLNRVATLYQYKEDIWEIIPDYDVGLTCSNAEAFGRVTVEYMISGLCPIVSNTGANTEIVNENTGIVYQKGDIDDLKNKIIFCIENRELIRDRGKTARMVAIKRFTIEKHAHSIYTLYKELLESKSRV